MRISLKEYYRKLLDNNKNNIKGLWNILNNVIGNGSTQVNYPHEFMENDMTIDNMDDAVNGFNKYFVNVGPILSEKVPVRSDDSNYDFIDINPKSMFLTAVEESEIIEIAHKCKKQNFY